MVYFFSYGDNRYRLSKMRIFNEAHFMGFDDIKVYGPENLPRDFVEKTNPHILHSRGGGYWLWKAYFLKKTFEKMNDGDICIYADAGCHLNPEGKLRLQEYINMINEHESGMLSFELIGFKEKMYTNQKVLEYFDTLNIDEMRESSIYAATMLYFRKCQNSMTVIDEFYKIATESPDLFSDIWNNYKKHSEFIDHRHDQSILSLLRKKHGSLVIPDETFSENWQELSHVPILATRIRQ